MISKQLAMSKSQDRPHVCATRLKRPLLLKRRLSCHNNVLRRQCSGTGLTINVGRGNRLAHPVGAGIDAALWLTHELLVDERRWIEGHTRLAEKHELLVALLQQCSPQQRLCCIHQVKAAPCRLHMHWQLCAMKQAGRWEPCIQQVRLHLLTDGLALLSSFGRSQ